ncbi:hypothetical protein VKT23_013292 [Stygiomarasmius scandens]|uniref:Uncharacterized protein n=1 Tax=Marasmiellus scandens TaxID=2682957 RepID=A0ABR1J9H7_9AGAR
MVVAGGGGARIAYPLPARENHNHLAPPPYPKPKFGSVPWTLAHAGLPWPTTA